MADRYWVVVEIDGVVRHGVATRDDLSIDGMQQVYICYSTNLHEWEMKLVPVDDVVWSDEYVP